MPEEEDGFTFVDKRNAPSAAEALDDAKDGSSTGSETATNESEQGTMSEDTEGAYSGDAPDTYLLLQYCVKLLAADAWPKLGLIADPRTGIARADLPQAKVAIDAIGDLVTRLETASDTVLPPSERRDLRNLLNDLRLNYVNQRSAGATPASSG